MTGKYFNVNTGGYGVSNCIIFRPDGIAEYEGWYTVEISGLSEGTLSYQVNFFNTSDADQPDASRYFTDVFTDQWYFDEVEYVYEHGIMGGTGGSQFQPTLTMTRAQAAQLFYNLEGRPSVSGTSDFIDVSGWCTDAVTWASQNGIIAGMGGNQYQPDNPLTREQFARMLYNYAQWKGYDLDTTADLTRFPDEASVSGWAHTEMEWAVGTGIITGSDGYLLPQGSASRAQIATMIMRFHQMFMSV